MSNHSLQVSYRFENIGTQRYYRIILSQDLFGEWVVTKIWGGIGKATGRVMHTHCVCHDDAIKLVDILYKTRKKRGYALC